MLSRRTRYAKALDRNRDLFDPAQSVLEVGLTDFGIAPLLQRKVTSLSPQLGEPPDQWQERVKGSVLDIPFGDRSFDIVVCMDGLEQIPKSSLSAALYQLTRVAREKVILSCPCGVLAADGERGLAELFQRTSVNPPPGLTAHLERGLPSTGELFQIIGAKGVPFEIWPLFDEICRIWFDLLVEFADAVPGDRGIPVQNRDVSFLAERIFDLWVRYRKSRGTEILEYPLFFIQ